ncbi:MAG: hypothetical protein QOD06_375 [Candidatus Binatota bacterium]|jgi:hypothetical protein|nr:hypothetical protein [Candidatus Binatota bacterium]
MPTPTKPKSKKAVASKAKVKDLRPTNREAAKVKGGMYSGPPTDPIEP